MLQTINTRNLIFFGIATLISMSMIHDGRAFAQTEADQPSSQSESTEIDLEAPSLYGKVPTKDTLFVSNECPFCQALLADLENEDLSLYDFDIVEVTPEEDKEFFARALSVCEAPARVPTIFIASASQCISGATEIFDFITEDVIAVRANTATDSEDEPTSETQNQNDDENADTAEQPSNLGESLGTQQPELPEFKPLQFFLVIIIPTLIFVGIIQFIRKFGL